jgi:hypothetical protein
VVIGDVDEPVVVPRPYRALVIQGFERTRIVGKKFHAAFIFQRQEFAVGVEYVAKRLDGGTSKDETFAFIRAIRGSKALPERWPNPPDPNGLPLLRSRFTVEFGEGI